MLIQGFEDILKREGVLGRSFKTPNIQSDYVIGIIPNYKENVNASDFEGVLLTALGNEYQQNGLSMEKNQWGLNAANLKFSNNFTFSFIGTGYSAFGKSKETKAIKDLGGNVIGTEVKESTAAGQYPSLVHYYYQRQLTDKGTLRIKTHDWKLPAVYIFNLRTSQPIYVLIDCRFGMPTFTTSPSSNDLIIYQTTVFYNSFKDLQNLEFAGTPDTYELPSEDQDFTYTPS